MSADLLLRNVRPEGGPLTDMLLRGGRIDHMGAGLPAAGAEVVDGAGALALPGLVEAHTHLDKTLLGMGWQPHSAGPGLMDKIDNERRLRRELGIDPERQSGRQLRQCVALGTTHFRTHVDVDTETGLAGIEGVMRMREAHAHLADVEIVAFPQSGLMIRPGTAALLDAAMKLGAEVVGGLDPCGIDRDPKGHLDVVFGLAEKHGRPVDIHLHEPGELGAFSMDLIIERTRALGMQGKVAISHAFCLGMPDVDLARALVARLARENIALVTTGAPSRPVPPLLPCREAGVTVAAGNDGIRDSWNPYGDGDMLERAMILGLRNNLRRDDEILAALAACTTQGAALMGLQGYGLAAGCVADLVLLQAESVAEAVVARPRPRTVIKRGRVVARDGALVG